MINPVTRSATLWFKDFLSITDDDHYLDYLFKGTLIWPGLFIDNFAWQLVPVYMVSCLGIFLPAFTKKLSFWIIFCLGLLFYYSRNFMVVDNHKWLFLYWSMGLGLTTLIPVREEAIEHMKKVTLTLIGVSFGLAVFWKIYHGQYWDGHFIEYMFLTDGRFNDFLRLSGLLTIEESLLNLNLSKNISYINGVAYPKNSQPLVMPETMSFVSLIVSYYTLVIESLIAGLFLAGLRWRSLLDSCCFLLIMFIVTVYVITPVHAYACLLSFFGFSIAPTKRWRLTMLGTFFFVQIIRMPILGYLNDLLNL